MFSVDTSSISFCNLEMVWLTLYVEYNVFSVFESIFVYNLSHFQSYHQITTLIHKYANLYNVEVNHERLLFLSDMKVKYIMIKHVIKIWVTHILLVNNTLCVSSKTYMFIMYLNWQWNCSTRWRRFWSYP